MSKQSEAKQAQGYTDKPLVRSCGNCEHFKTERALPAWMARDKAAGRKAWNGREYSLELDGVAKNLRCGIGGFAVKKLGCCDHFQAVEVKP